MRGEAAVVGMFLALMLAIGCGHQVAVPVAASSTASGDPAHLPFARSGQTSGISPSSAVIPPGAQISSGTAVTVHVQSAISSATAHAGDDFDAVLDEPIVLDGQVMAERGATVTGRVMEAKAAGFFEPGYLRLTLGSISLRGRTCSAQSSSAFIKGESRKKDIPINGSVAGRNGFVGVPLPGATAYAGGTPLGQGGKGPTRRMKDVNLGPERRLIFRLTEPIPLAE